VDDTPEITRSNIIHIRIRALTCSSGFRPALSSISRVTSPTVVASMLYFFPRSVTKTFSDPPACRKASSSAYCIEAKLEALADLPLAWRRTALPGGGGRSSSVAAAPWLCIQGQKGRQEGRRLPS
jgi:hypothetical protein